jgi:hypothetical protein
MLLDAAETVLGIFGFDRTLYCKQKDKRWWMELRRNAMNYVEAEAGR